MARKAISQPYVNVSLGSVKASDGTASTVPDYAPGDKINCDSGQYIYMQANGAVVEGYLCKYVEGTYDADTCTTAESGSTATPLGVCVTSGGLVDNQWGWFWRGLGSGEYVYLTTTIAADTQVTTHTVAGQGSTGGDPIHSLFANVSSGSGGLTLCRSSVLLCTNDTITN
jgi:hypothetical protein